MCRVPRADTDGGTDAATDGGTDASRAKVCGHYVTSDAVIHYIYQCADIPTIGLYDPTCLAF